MTKYTFSYRHHESFLTDVFIIGSNPILTHLLLVKLHKEHLNDFYQHNKKINVTILVDHNADYWSYHTLMQPEYLQEINQKTGLRLKKIEDLFDYCGELYTEHSPWRSTSSPTRICPSITATKSQNSLTAMCSCFRTSVL